MQKERILYPLVASIVPEGRHGTAEVRHFTPSKEDIARLFREEGEHIEHRVHAELRINRQLVMSDSSMEHRSNEEVIRRSHGHVLIGGLGLGMILPPLLAKREVATVTVIEKNTDVIALVGPHYANDRLLVISGDIHEWWPPEGVFMNTIYFDIWPTRGDNQRAGFNELRSRYLRCLDPDDPAAWIGSWWEAELEMEEEQRQKEEKELSRLRALPAAEQFDALLARARESLSAELRAKGFADERIQRYMELRGEEECRRDALETQKRWRRQSEGEGVY